MSLLIGAIVLIAVLLGWAYRFDRRHGSGAAAQEGPDTMRSRIEGSMVMGRSWRSGGSGPR